ncbi:MAG: hypothetical protein LBI53_02735 [Candidatus Peribacteria bacterium]|jgi:tRNA A37 threonylcarbamoyltransferase TsaD|nr:hypothetical protein [Candidatus Peribacteria bacterium]
MKSQVSFLLDRISPLLKGGQGGSSALTPQQTADIAYEFQEATIETLAKRLLKIAKEYQAQTIAIAG